MKEQARQRPDWLLFDEDESWFSRFAQPTAHAWALPGEALHLVQREPKRAETEKALSCFGARRQDTQQVYLYFSPGQPNSEHMWVFIIALLDIARQEGKSVVVLIWDNASWHISQRIRQWIRAYNRAAKALVNRAYGFMSYRSKAPGSIRLNPVGFMPNALSANPNAI